MGIKAIDLRRGVAVEWNNKLYTVHDFAKVSKGNWRSFMQVKLRDTGTGSIIEQRFRVDDELQQAFLDQKAMEYLYSEQGKHHFMDLNDFDQIELSGDVVGEAVQYLKPNTQVQVTMYQGKPFSIELPNTVELVHPCNDSCHCDPPGPFHLWPFFVPFRPTEGRNNDPV